jgi:hypothetical protein
MARFSISLCSSFFFLFLSRDGEAVKMGQKGVGKGWDDRPWGKKSGVAFF